MRGFVRLLMVLHIAAAVVYSFFTVNKLIDIASYLVDLSILTNGFFYLPRLAGLLAQRRPRQGDPPPAGNG